MLNPLCVIVPLALANVSDPAQLADASFQSENVSRLVQPAMRKITIAKTRPANVRVTPPAKIAAWAAWPFGPKDHTRTITLAMTDPAAGAPNVWADGNGDGDFSNDPPVKCDTVKDSTGQPSRWEGDFYVTAPALSNRPLKVKFLRYTPAEAQRRKVPADTMFCYADYGWSGKLVVGDKKYAALLVDGSATGDFTLPRDSSTGLSMYVDVNNNGTFESPERFGPNETINLGSAAVVLSSVSADGRDVKLSGAAVNDPRIRPVEAADLGPAPKFAGMCLDGKKVTFPDDFKGKLVLLDFWATWCEPCKMEIPFLTAAYKKHHAAGLEILSLSIDSRRDLPTLRAMVKTKEMTWRHVHPGNVIGGIYGVSTIPRGFLVDGDTGKILASGSALRGESLDETLSAALAKKFGSAPAAHKP